MQYLATQKEYCLNAFSNSITTKHSSCVFVAGLGHLTRTKYMLYIVRRVYSLLPEAGIGIFKQFGPLSPHQKCSWYFTGERQKTIRIFFPSPPSFSYKNRTLVVSLYYTRFVLSHAIPLHYHIFFL